MKPKRKAVKGWAVVCNRSKKWQVFNTSARAKDHKEDLDDAYDGACKHEIVPCLITFTISKGNKEK